MDVVLTSARFVASHLPSSYRETQFSRALALELQARGYNTHCEAPCPATFLTSDGRRHVLSNDRVDVVVYTPGKIILIEVKKGPLSASAVQNAEDQARRYKHSYQEYISHSVPLEACTVFFHNNTADVRGPL